MEFATPGQDPAGGVQGQPEGATTLLNLPLQQTQDFGGTVSLSSAGNSGSLSQASATSMTGAVVAAPLTVQPQSGVSPAPQAQQMTAPVQAPQASLPPLFNPLQLTGIAGVIPPAFALGSTPAVAAPAATIGVPLSAPTATAMNTNNGVTVTSGQKRKSETDLLHPSKEHRTIEGFDDPFSGKGPPVKDDAELEKMNPAERRRYERNLREQQRSYRISQQIKQLRDVLEESKIPFKPNKFSILVSVVEYIKQLQTRAIMLDAEHQKLIDTIRDTNEMVSTGQIPSSTESSNGSADAATSGGTDSSELTLAAAKELDFQVVFQCCPSGMAVCSLDGRILACNKSFESSLGVKKQDVLQQSMFIYIRNHQDIFEAMADLLKRSSVASEAGEGVVRASHLLFWCGHVMSLP